MHDGGEAAAFVDIPRETLRDRLKGLEALSRQMKTSNYLHLLRKRRSSAGLECWSHGDFHLNLFMCDKLLLASLENQQGTIGSPASSIDTLP